MTRVRSPGGWTDGSTVPGTEFEALDEGQHTAIKSGVGAAYNVTGNPITLTGTALRVAGDGLKLDSADGPAYSGGMAGAPLTKTFMLDPGFYVPLGNISAAVWEVDPTGLAQRDNNGMVWGACALQLSAWHKQKLRRLRLRIRGYEGHATDGDIVSMERPKFALAVMDMLAGPFIEDVLYPVGSLVWYEDPSSTIVAYESLHWIDSGANAYNITIDKTRYNYVLFIEGESGTGSLADPRMVAFAVEATLDISSIPFG